MGRKDYGPLFVLLLTLLGAWATIYLSSSAPARTVLLILYWVLVAAYFVYWLSTKIDAVSAWSNLRQFRKLGVRRLYAKGVKPGPWNEMAQSRNIRIMAVSANGLLKQLKPELVKALADKRAHVRILLAQSKSQFVRDIEEVESVHRRGEISHEIDSIKSLLTEYVEAAVHGTAKEDIGTVEVGSYSTHLRMSMTLGDGWGWLTLNLPPKRAVESTSFELSNSEGTLLRDCVEHFDACWGIAKQRGQVTEVTPKPHNQRTAFRGRKRRTT